MVGFDYLAVVLIVVATVVTALMQVGLGTEGDENIPDYERWDPVPLIFLITIGYDISSSSIL
jgi:hypothetical protein